MVVGQAVPAGSLGLAGFGDGVVYEMLAFVVEGRGDGGVFDERDAVARLHVRAEAESGLCLFFDSYGVGGGLLAVLEELVGHGVAHLCVFPSGLCPEVGTIFVDAGAKYIPYFFFLLVILVGYDGVQRGEEGELSGVVDGGDAVFHQAQVGMCHVIDMLHVYAHLVSFGRSSFKVSVGDAGLHVEAAAEAVYLPLGQIQFLVNEPQADA